VSRSNGCRRKQFSVCLNGKKNDLGRRDVVTFRTSEESGGSGRAVQVFAGQRSDPFFIDGPMTERTIATRQVAFKEVGSDRLYGKNVLGIVLRIEWATLLKGGPMFAVVAETLSAGKRPVPLERVGRPEIKNISLSAKMFDTVNRDLEIRDIYNEEDAFNLSKHYAGAYRARLNANLAFYDGLDDKVDWPFDNHGNHPLTELLLADFLVVDASKPFSETSYFEIEQAMLEGVRTLLAEEGGSTWTWSTFFSPCTSTRERVHESGTVSTHRLCGRRRCSPTWPHQIARRLHNHDRRAAAHRRHNCFAEPRCSDRRLKSVTLGS
jgi:hypothetical protein